MNEHKEQGGKEIMPMPSFEESAERLKFRVKLAFVDLMPESQFKLQIEQILEKFMAPRPNNYNGSKKSEFEEILTKEVESVVKPMIMAEVKSQIDDKLFNTVNLTKFVAECAPTVLNKIMKDTIQNTLQQIQQNTY